MWQGQYLSGATPQQGLFGFRFEVFDNLTSGNSCYVREATLQTGLLGQWSTERVGVGAACDDPIKDYFLDITINGEQQVPRRLLLNLALARGKFFATKLVAPELNLSAPVINHISDYNGSSSLFVRNSNPSNLSSSLFSVVNDVGSLFSMTLTSSNYYSVPNNKSFADQPSLEQSTFNNMFFVNGRLSGFEWLNNPLNDSSNVVQTIMSLEPNGDLNVTGRIRGNLVGLNSTIDSRASVFNDSISIQQVNTTQNIEGLGFVNKSRVYNTSTSDSRFLNLSGQNANQNVNTGIYNLTANTGFFSFLGGLTDRVLKIFTRELRVSDNATIENLVIRRHDAFGPAILLNSTTEAIRLFAAPNITNPTNGAGLQLFGNNAGFFPGDVYIDAGSTSGGQIIMRTGTTGLNDRIVVEDDGRVKVLNMTGNGTDYVCVDSNGYLFRSNTAC